MAGEKFGREAGVLAISPRLDLFRADLFQGGFCSGWMDRCSTMIEQRSLQNRRLLKFAPVCSGLRGCMFQGVEQRKLLILADCSICSMCSILSLWEYVELCK
jgi:hypothetical protein